MKSIIKTVFLFILFFNSNFLFAQSVSISHIGSSSEVTSNQEGVSIAWTIGQIYGGTTVNDYHITAGFHQGEFAKKNENEPSTSKDQFSIKLDAAPEIEVSALLFPNPTSRYINLKFEELLQSPTTIRLFDLAGNLVLQKKIDTSQSTHFQLDEIEDLPSGTYFLNFVHQQIKIPTQKLTKI